ncbi:hypothetical protein COOONC_05612 [Cooperia oncophora]
MMMRYTTDFLFIPPPLPGVPLPPSPDLPLPGPTSRLSQSLLHLHVVGSTPHFTPISVGGSPITSNWMCRFQRQKSPPNDLDTKSLITVLRDMRLTEEQLVANSFPRWKNGDRTTAVVEPSFFDTITGRREFIPDDDVRIHPCCGRAQGVAGCQHSDSHVTDTMRESVLLEFHATPEPTGPSDPRSDAFYALDCEFVYTTVGKEAARITVVDSYGNEVMDCVFRPEHELVDPNTRYSGLTVEDIQNTDQTLSDSSPSQMMMRYTTDFLFIPPPLPGVPLPPSPDLPLPGPTSRLSQSLLHLHVVGSTPHFTPISVGGSPITSNWMCRFQRQKSPPNDLDTKSLITVLRDMRLTEEQLVANSFPRWKNGDRTTAVVEPSFFDTITGRREFIPDDDTRRRCVRCHAHYRLPLCRKRVDFCIHHAEPAIYSSDVRIHPCCGRAQGVAGCQHSDSHVTDTMRESVLLEFHATPEPTGPSDPRSDAFYALDCEFVYTTVGKEAARITVVDSYGNEVMDCVFRPEHELVDPNTRYSGLTVEDIQNTDQTLSDIREVLFEMINSETLLIGHALENDLKALRIVHDNVIDTFRFVFGLNGGSHQ